MVAVILGVFSLTLLGLPAPVALPVSGMPGEPWAVVARSTASRCRQGSLPAPGNEQRRIPRLRALLDEDDTQDASSFPELPGYRSVIPLALPPTPRSQATGAASLHTPLIYALCTLLI